MRSGQIDRVHGSAEVERTQTQGGPLLDQLAGYGSMDLMALGVQVGESRRSRAVEMIQAVVNFRNRQMDAVLKHLAD